MQTFNTYLAQSLISAGLAATQSACAAGPGPSCADNSKIGYEGNAWKLVPEDTCLQLKTPFDKGSYKLVQQP